MNSKELFALFLRAIGTLGVIFIVRHVLIVIPYRTPAMYMMVKWAIGVVVALYLVRGAPLLLKFAYPKTN